MRKKVFTDSQDESDAIKIMLNLKSTETSATDEIKSTVKGVAGRILGEKGKKIVRILREK